MMKNRLEDYPTTVKAGSKSTTVPSKVKTQQKSSLEKVSDHINAGLAKYPAVTLGTGLVLGAILGWYIKRR